MTTHIHGVTKSAKATVEKLPDISGTQIKYGGNTDCTVDVTQRDNSEPTVTAGSAGTAGGYSGIINSQVTKAVPTAKEDGSVVWETVTGLDVEGDSV